MARFFVEHYAQLFLVILICIGFFGMVARRNLVRKLIGMSVLLTAVILFWIVSAYKRGATVPILLAGEEHPAPEHYMNPLPHALMLTAIVVAVVTTGVAIALLVKIHRNYGTLEEDRILEQL